MNIQQSSKDHGRTFLGAALTIFSVVLFYTASGTFSRLDDMERKAEVLSILIDKLDRSREGLREDLTALKKATPKYGDDAGEAAARFMDKIRGKRGE